MFFCRLTPAPPQKIPEVTGRNMISDYQIPTLFIVSVMMLLNSLDLLLLDTECVVIICCPCTMNCETVVLVYSVIKVTLLSARVQRFRPSLRQQRRRSSPAPPSS